MSARKGPSNDNVNQGIVDFLMGKFCLNTFEYCSVLFSVRCARTCVCSVFSVLTLVTPLPTTKDAKTGTNVYRPTRKELNDDSCGSNETRMSSHWGQAKMQAVYLAQFAMCCLKPLCSADVYYNTRVKTHCRLINVLMHKN